jgi:YfiH family protein
MNKLEYLKDRLYISRASYEDAMLPKESNGLIWFSFPAIDKMPCFINAFSTRIGGVSKGDFASWDVSYGRGNDPESVKENIRLLGQAAGFAPERVVLSDQVQSVNVRRVGSADCGNGYNRECSWHDADGIITDEEDVILMTLHADCLPLYFIDTEHTAIGLSHAGWKGSVDGRMVKNTICAMEKEFGTRPRDLMCAIGPAISQESYEVGEDVAKLFRDEFLIEKGDGKFLLDLPASNRQAMIEQGVLEDRIILSGICTCRNKEFFFSQRGHGRKRGNNAAFLGIRSEF